MIEIILAAIPTAGLVWVAFVNRAPLKKVDAMAKQILQQVQNDHDSNLREDIDGLGEKIDRVHRAAMHTADEQQRLAAKQELAQLQARVEHAKLWDAVTGGEPPMPPTTETEIIELKKEEDL